MSVLDALLCMALAARFHRKAGDLRKAVKKISAQVTDPDGRCTVRSVCTARDPHRVIHVAVAMYLDGAA